MSVRLTGLLARIFGLDQGDQMPAETAPLQEESAKLREIQQTRERQRRLEERVGYVEASVDVIRARHRHERRHGRAR